MLLVVVLEEMVVLSVVWWDGRGYTAVVPALPHITSIHPILPILPISASTPTPALGNRHLAGLSSVLAICRPSSVNNCPVRTEHRPSPHVSGFILRTA
jgi:hypothetical protein